MATGGATLAAGAVASAVVGSSENTRSSRERPRSCRSPRSTRRAWSTGWSRRSVADTSDTTICPAIAIPRRRAARLTGGPK